MMAEIEAMNFISEGEEKGLCAGMKTMCRKRSRDYTVDEEDGVEYNPLKRTQLNSGLVKWESASFGYDNPHFSDCALHMITKNQIRTIRVSKLSIFQESQFLITNYGRDIITGKNDEIIVNLSSDLEMERFNDIIRIIYGQKPLANTNEEYYSILLLAEIYEFYGVLQHIGDEISKRITTVEEACWLIEILESNPPRNSQITRQLTETAESHFKPFAEQFETTSFKPEFLDLPFSGVRTILENLNIHAFSENTVYYVIMMWYQKDPDTRLKYLPQLLEHIHFPEISNMFLLSVVSQAHQYLPKDISDIVEAKRIMALEDKLNTIPDSIIESPPLNRTFMNTKKPITINFSFCNMSTFQVNQGRLSSPYYRNGYVFQFFMESVLKPGRKDNRYKDYHLKGGLRCQTLSTNFYLPVEFSMYIVSAQEPRVFGPFKATFESSKSAFGCILNKPNEDLSQVVAGTCPIIKKDSLIIQIQMKF